MKEPSIELMLEREAVANTPKHWVRAVTACNSRCLFCLDSDTPRNVLLPEAEVKAEIDRGIDQLGAEKIIISGGEASLHPLFTEFVRYARERGYSRVQTVTNGFRFQERDFFEKCMQAGLGEITFSLHGHTPELHNRLTGTANAFEALVKGMVRAVRDGRPIVNVDVVINRQNVGHIDAIVELCLSLGVSEFDLLHVIPQAAAFENRDQLFYDVREHLPRLQKVFRLNRSRRVTIWTNRFPVNYLEGLEDLIQDPHKMLDEVNGRRFQVRRYLDLGATLDCRQKERCEHCFIEPFCTTMDRVVEAQNSQRFEVYWLAHEPYQGEALPFGCSAVGVSRERAADITPAFLAALPAGAGLYLELADPSGLPAELAGERKLTLVATTAEQLAAYLPHLPADARVEIRLNQATARWLLDNRALLAPLLERLSLHQPSHEHLSEAHADDVRSPRDFFTQLALPGIRVSGLPACLAPGARLAEEPKLLPRALFDRESGRLDIRALATFHVRERYRAKSVRCADCRVFSRCEGIHINMIRDQGLGLAHPLVSGDEAQAAERELTRLFPEVPGRLATGRSAERPAPSLPGFDMPERVAEDPLAIIQAKQLLRKQRAKGPVPAPEGPRPEGQRPEGQLNDG
jgi:MoaA/NifB/PqqE/SkfB family radical SAM enzyme